MCADLWKQVSRYCSLLLYRCCSSSSEALCRLCTGLLAVCLPGVWLAMSLGNDVQ